jgi:hypothetical protein
VVERRTNKNQRFDLQAFLEIHQQLSRVCSDPRMQKRKLVRLSFFVSNHTIVSAAK